MASTWHTVSPMTRPLNLEILEITPLSLTVSLSLAPQPRWASSFSPSASGTTTAQADLLIQGQQQFGVPAAKQRKARSKGHRHGQGHQAGASAAHESEEELTAVEDNGDGPSHAHLLHPHTSNSAPPYTSSSLPGSYPRRLPLSSTHTDPSSAPSFKELLSKGIVVTVNGNPWSRIVAHVSDDDVPIPTSAAATTTSGHDQTGEQPTGLSAVVTSITTGSTPASFPTPSIQTRSPAATHRDRAIVVVYGLEPGKEYEVDLKILGQLADVEAHGTATTSVTTPAHHVASLGSGTRSRANSLRSRPQAGRSRSSSLIQSVVPQQVNSGSTSTNSDAAQTEKTDPANATATSEVTLNPLGGSGVVAGTWTAAGASLTPHDAHLRDLGQLVSAANAEKEELASQLKKSRRESQKAEAALRSELEALKRAMEKTALPDLRSRQKSLALQEQVKQAFHGAAEAEREYEEIQKRLESWRQQEVKVKDEWTRLQSARNEALEQRNNILDSGKKALTELDTQLAQLKMRVAKQTGKHEKLQKENKELREKLESVASARREVEKRNETVRHQQMLADDYSASGYGGRGGYWDQDVSSGWNARSGMLGMRAAEPAYGMTPAQEELAYNPAVGPPGAFSRSRQGSVATFQPRGSSSGGNAFLPPSRPNSMTTTANSAAAALATQGIPRSATSGISHLGNPTGFFASVATAPGTSSQQMTARGVRASMSTNVSPMMANVTAAPFMPASTQFHPTATPSPPASQHEHTTSLVPPQLQHRIYLPGNRGNRISPSGGGIIPNLPSTISPAMARADIVTPDLPHLTTPSFPPLPSQAHASQPAAAHGQKAPPGPSLASIVTRAIIPPNSSLMHNNQLQKSPVVASDENSPSLPTRNPGRPLSWRTEHDPSASSTGDEFPSLSPVVSWTTTVDQGRHIIDGQSSAVQQPWGIHRPGSASSRNPSRRGSLAAVHERDP